MENVPQNLLITKNIAKAIVIHDHEKYQNYMSFFEEQDLIEMKKQNPKILKYVKNQTFDMCHEAIKSITNRSRNKLYTELFYGGNGLWYNDISTDFVSYFNPDYLNKDEMIKLYSICYELNKYSIQCMIAKYVPYDMILDYLNIRPDFINICVNNGDYNIDENQIKEIYNHIVKKSISNIIYVNHKYQTQEMVEKIKNDKNGVYYYKYLYCIDNIGQELYLNAFNMDHDIIKLIPDKYINENMYLNAFEYNIKNIKYIPNKYQTQEMCKRVASIDVNLIQYCEYIDDDLLKYINKQFINLPKKDRFYFINSFNTDTIIKILKKYPYALRVINKKKLTDDMIKIALELNGYLLEYVDNQTKEYIDIAIKNQPKAVKYIKQFK